MMLSLDSDMKSLVYEKPVPSVSDLIAQISVAYGRKRDMRGIFENDLSYYCVFTTITCQVLHIICDYSKVWRSSVKIGSCAINPNTHSKYTGSLWIEKFEALKRGLKSQQSLFTKVNTEQEATTRTRFLVALRIAKRGKSFTDGEMIKECVIEVEEMCSEKWFSLALHESTNVSDTTQGLIFIRGVNKSYEVHEELLDIDSIYSPTTGEDICKGVDNVINKKELSIEKLEINYN
ncbi:general transcription factor II-I repeat domain-containing protein 2 [Trichonephila clavipes]|nr:general transcription factor II-I repeat domain-containing protein 2 [Trichonephila clavipes]